MTQHYCPRCGQQRLSSTDNNCYHCEHCDFEVFRNVAAAVGVVLLCGQDVLVVKRNKAPAEGAWDLPGGFVNAGESAEQALRRECLEETGIELSGKLHYLGAWPNQYPYKGLLYPTLDIFFAVRLDALPACRLEKEEVSAYAWVKKYDCAALSMAFPSAQLALQYFLASDQQLI